MAAVAVPDIQIGTVAYDSAWCPRQTDTGAMQGSGKQRGWNDKNHAWCCNIRAVSGGLRLRTFKTKAFARFADREGTSVLPCARPSIALGADLSMPIWAAAWSSSASPARVAVGPAGSARSCCFAGANWRFSSMASRSAAERIFAGTSWRHTDGGPTSTWRWSRRASRQHRRLER